MTSTPDIISLATNAHHCLTSVVKDQAELKKNKKQTNYKTNQKKAKKPQTNKLTKPANNFLQNS